MRLAKPATARGLLEKMFVKLQCDFPGWRLGLVIPAGAWNPPPFPLGSIKVLHGGLRLKLYTGVIPGD